MANSENTGRLRAFLEIIFFVTIALGSKQLLDPYIWRYAGPISLLITLTLLAIYMRRRGMRWSDMGLKPLPGLKRKLMLIPQALLTFAAFMAAVALALFGKEAMGWEFMNEIPNGVEERWGDIRGNLPLYILWMIIAWVSAGFGEEVFFRGFMITRLEAGFAGLKLAPVIAVVLSALLFGFVHMYYQGLRGLVTTGLIGLALGIMFLALKKNLWPIILVHGIVDSIGFTARYLGME